ncbi:hypothetical protein D0T11_15660 [Hymenobacter rubripertinctus]|uniref:Uncharacterized protein n=2 Tax=Hymenobacter rubripertinctus TaxID=2029981 RepID=A0A418QRT7_9BACT|nr:hypothetical protein D0T11_15660 [Hymenobacter rubripertinctus]
MIQLMKILLPSFLVVAALLTAEVALAAPAAPTAAPATRSTILTTTANTPDWGKLKRKKRRQAAYQRLRKRRH